MHSLKVGELCLMAKCLPNWKRCCPVRKVALTRPSRGIVPVWLGFQFDQHVGKFSKHIIVS